MNAYDFTPAAEEDLRDIWSYSHKTWGQDQADRYLDQIEACCDAIGKGRAQSRSFETFPKDLRIHRCERHYIVWLAGDRPIIIAILHERMDFLQRLKDRL